MIIVLSEEGSPGSVGPERSFDKAVVRVGRDPFESDLAFDNAKYPMVSRKHAEIRFIDGAWFVVDLGSSYGTFLNGEKFSGGREISVGQKMQFGESGPVFRVVRFGEVPKPDESFSLHRSAPPDPFHSKPPKSAYQDPFAVKPR